MNKMSKIAVKIMGDDLSISAVANYAIGVLRPMSANSPLNTR